MIYYRDDRNNVVQREDVYNYIDDRDVVEKSSSESSCEDYHFDHGS